MYTLHDSSTRDCVYFSEIIGWNLILLLLLRNQIRYSVRCGGKGKGRETRYTIVRPDR